MTHIILKIKVKQAEADSMKPIKTLKDEYINSNMLELFEQDEVIEEVESFFLTPLNQQETGLPMCIHLRCIENKGEPPFLRFQNDRSKKYNSNWVKIYIDGSFNNYENKKFVFTVAEMQALKDWIITNKEIIIKHYYQEYDSFQVCRTLKNYKE